MCPYGSGSQSECSNPHVEQPALLEKMLPVVLGSEEINKGNQSPLRGAQLRGETEREGQYGRAADFLFRHPHYRPAVTAQGMAHGGRTEE